VQFDSRRTLEVTVATGTVKKVISDRGFGFITAEDGKDYFFHRDGLQASLDFDRLVGGERVEFDVQQSPKGPRAVGVRALTGATAS
jgi:CspA family cold shock protein